MQWDPILITNLGRVISTILRAGGQTVLIVCTSLTLTSCQSNPISIQQKAIESGWQLSIRNKPNELPLVLLRSHNSSTANRPLHIYIEGDGLPWRTSTQISNDPTPRHPVAMHLMQYDPGPALYLGRPCYFGLQKVQPCNADYWTSARYSEKVVETLNHAIQEALDAGSHQEAVLIGYSGGGSLAILLANRNSRIKGALLIAPNFDTAVWTQHHGFTPLYHSMNPAQEKKPRPYPEIYWFGDEDQNVPAILFASIAARRDHVSVVRLADLDHACCWTRMAQKGELMKAISLIEAHHDP